MAVSACSSHNLRMISFAGWHSFDASDMRSISRHHHRALALRSSSIGLSFRSVGKSSSETPSPINVSPFIPRSNIERTPIATHTHLTATLDSVAAGRVATVRDSGLLVGGGAAMPISVALVATGCLAAVCERRTKAGGIIGAPLLCFCAFCILSNLHLVPAAHAAYDLCWSFLLPLSLSIIILGNPVVAEERSASTAFNHDNKGGNDSKSTGMGPVGRVGVAFGIGAAGSLAGAAAAFKVAVSSCAGVFALPRETAAQIAGAVVATYIGGSVNLLAVASAVGLREATSVGGASLLVALAASDIFLMALYFSGLVAAHKTPVLHRIFPSADSNHLPTGDLKTPVTDRTTVESGLTRGGLVAIAPHLSTTAATTLGLLAVGSAVCIAGNALAAKSPFPGTATMTVTLLALGIWRVFSRVAPALHANLSPNAPPIAAVLLNMFFASLGASGRCKQLVGVAPTIFAFASLALIVHIIVVGVGTAVSNRCFGTFIGIDDIIVASNANIGGPSTAATFAGLIGQDALVVPAAMWGTVGYAIATTIGVGLWAYLR